MATVVAGEISAAAVAHVREALAHHELLKIRVACDSGDECDAAGRQLAERVPCEFVARIGRIVLLHRPVDVSREP